VQLHYLDDDHSNDAVENLAVLCLECHHQTQVRGGVARHLSPSEVTKCRDDWHSRVQKRRDQADALAVEVMAKVVRAADRRSLPVEEYIRALPALRKGAYAAARTASDGGTLRSVEGSFAIIDVMQVVLMALASYYPRGHFGADNVRDYMSELLATHLRWQYHRHQPRGHGNDGSTVNALVAESVLTDTEHMVVELVESLTLDLAAPNNSGFLNWKREWDASRHLQPSVEVDVSSGKRAVVSVTNRGEPFTLSMRGQLVKSNTAIEHLDPFEFLPRRVSEGNPITDYTIATVDAFGVVAVYGEHLAVIQTWQCVGKRKLRFRLALTFLSNEHSRAQPVSKCLIEVECDPKTARLKARVMSVTPYPGVTSQR
jgi:hypothetical protein